MTVTLHAAAARPLRAAEPAVLIDDAGSGVTLAVGGANADAAAVEHAILETIEVVTAERGDVERIRVVGSFEPAVADRLALLAAARPVDGALELRPAQFWQIAPRWLADPKPPQPEHRVVTNGRGHPERAGKPEGVVYSRRIPWLDRTLAFRTATGAGDVALLNRWMNDPRVAAIWDEAGPIEAHRAYRDRLVADPHMLPLIGTLDGEPFGWFEVYWAMENRLGPLYDADPYDRGWHVAIGEEGCRGKAYVSAWLPSLVHFMFLDDPRTRRIVGEPRADHHQQLRNLDRSGFSRVGTVDFPHKRAALVMLTRERFFGDRLWAPAG